MKHDCHTVLILGSSTRAAAHSAIRAGLQPVCGDMFADQDLRAVARILPVANYPEGLELQAEQAPPGPWLFTGALENHPQLIGRISKHRPLWGNGPRILRQLRDPENLVRELQQAGLPHLPVWTSTRPPPTADGQWMLKPCRGSAGRGIQVWDAVAGARGLPKERCYFQRRARGIPISALFLAVPGETFLLGSSRQLIGLPEVHAPSHAWCGSLTPTMIPGTANAVIQRLGAWLGHRLEIRGLFGCDFLLDGETPWLTEVNPRFPGSAELIELQLRAPILNWHGRACDAFGRLDFSTRATTELRTEVAQAISRTPRGVLGKMILYAGHDLIVGDYGRFIHLPVAEYRVPVMADIPVPGQLISRGSPICTVFAEGVDETDCLNQLRARRARLQSTGFSGKFDQ